MKTTLGGNGVSTTTTVTSAGAVIIKAEPFANLGLTDLQGTTVTTISKRPASLDLKQTTATTSTLTKKQQLQIQQQQQQLLLQQQQQQQQQQQLQQQLQQLQLPPPLIIDSSIQDPGSSKSLGTPDFEKILHLLPTPQPGQLFPTKATAVTSEQEAFGKGFEDALHNLHNSKTSKASNGGGVTSTSTQSSGQLLSGGSFTYTNLDSFPITVKDEPSTVPIDSSPHRIDMETQEKIKLERKRQRNRVAASKCRKRKLERITKLEEKVKTLKSENGDLALIVKNLKDLIAQLKQQVMEHMQAGCRIQTICNGQTTMVGK